MNVKNNLVSIWCGFFENEENFLEYLEIDYDSEQGSQFMRNFSIEWYDEDLSESGFYNEDNLISNVRNHSYGNSFSRNLEKDLLAHTNCNSLLLIYDFDGSNLPTNSNAQLHFVGVYQYDKNNYESVFNMP